MRRHMVGVCVPFVIFIIFHARIITCGALHKFTRGRLTNYKVMPLSDYSDSFVALKMETLIGFFFFFCLICSSFDLDNSIEITHGAFACYYLLVPEYFTETIFFWKIINEKISI